MVRFKFMSIYFKQISRDSYDSITYNSPSEQPDIADLHSNNEVNNTCDMDKYQELTKN